MSALASMLRRLSPVRMYSLSEDSLVYAELAAFSAGLDILQAELSEILRESFSSTAESWGLQRQERLFGKARDELDTEKRREMLLSRSSFGYDDFTLSGIQKIFTLLGVSGTLYEYPKLCRIVLDMSTGQYSQGERRFLRSQALALLPAHLEIDVVFSGFSWKILEEQGASFGELEASGYTWGEIDLLSL